MLTFIVMPCLNEADLIARTTASLGFSAEGDVPADTHLVVVDNGSTDGTIDILGRIRDAAGAPVHICSEVRRGYVPPRHRGVIEAAEIARRCGADPADVLILQADADADYKRGYVVAMQSAATGKAGVMLEGSIRRPDEFVDTHPGYVAAEHLVDDEVEPRFATDQDDVVVDDKVCGYRLADYNLWGGLFEENTARGDAIHVETTRLFMRARLAHGARKVRVNPAGAAPSSRKVALHPWLHYATAGFPREDSWARARTQQAARSDDAHDMDRFALAVLDGLELEAVYLRRAHQLALFRFLPALVAVALAGGNSTELLPDVRAALDALPRWSLCALQRDPGKAVIGLLDLIDTHPELFGAGYLRHDRSQGSRRMRRDPIHLPQRPARR